MNPAITIAVLMGTALLGPSHAIPDANVRLHETNDQLAQVGHPHASSHVGTEAAPGARAHLPSWTLAAPDSRRQCAHEAERNLTVAADPGDRLWLDAGSGSLEVVGVPGLDEVRVVARACASHEDYLDELRIDSRRNGGEISVGTHYPDLDGWSVGNRYARLDLRLEVPEAMPAEIHDASGEMSVGHLGSLRIDDGSGKLEVFSIRGDVSIDDGSGEIVLWDVTGNVEIEDGSGEMELEGIGGNVVLDDGSGEIDIRDVEGGVRINRDGSGSIFVDGVVGDFVVERDGSGSIRYENVQGTVEIPTRR